ALLLLALGLCLSHMLRFVMPAFPLLFMAWAAWAWERGGVWPRFLAGAGLASALLCLPSLLAVSARYFDGAGVWTGAETRERYLQRMVQDPYEDLALWTAAHLPPDARILLVGDARGLYWRRDFLANSVFDEPALARIARQSAGPAQMAERVRRSGITAAAVNLPEGVRTAEDYQSYGEMTGADWKRLDRYLALYWTPLVSDGRSGVWAVRDVPRTGGATAVDPFSFFTPRAYDLSRALAGGDIPRAIGDARAQAALFPGGTFWDAQLASLEKKTDHPSGAATP
ncbi:MAG TPA: hypothetical protein VFR02_05115, partial [bacterium]|nr:hypothetical protein [bacterium]